MIAAFVGLKFWKSVLAISAGNLVAALILMLLVYFAQAYVDIILIVFISIMVVSALVIIGRKWQKKRVEKENIQKAESCMPPEAKPVIGEFAAGHADSDVVVEIVENEKGNPLEDEIKPKAKVNGAKQTKSVNEAKL